MKSKVLILTIAMALLLAAPLANAQDGTTSASVVVDQESLMNAAAEDGTWILIIQQDLSVDEEIVLEGEHTNRDEVDRKLALYEQDEDHEVTERYTLEAPSITVKSPSTRFQGGTFVGDVYVEANNFALRDFVVEGNVYFENEEAKETFTIGDGATVTGNLE